MTRRERDICKKSFYSKNNKGVSDILVKSQGKHIDSYQKLDLCFFLFIAETLGLDPEVAKVNILGFVGCLSSVQYNHIAPLKAALRHSGIAPVTVQGTLTESGCDSTLDSDVNAVTTVHSSLGTSQRVLS